MRIPNHHVSVDFQRFGNNITVHVISEPMQGQGSKWNSTKIDTTFKVKKSDFDKIVSAVQQINCTDITSAIDSGGLDGSTCEISFGGLSSGISYKIWSPDYDTEKRNLTQFLAACEMILRAVGMIFNWNIQILRKDKPSTAIL